ncbi:MAG TPA: hypothetical protein VKY74_10095, partial [Chloroflexia bacterium]|nr:hypothetical protein [Chloroflexia bacterium]
TYQAARLLQAAGWPVGYYEDFPYAARPDAAAQRFTELGVTPAVTGATVTPHPATPVYCAIDATMGPKIAAIAAYASQISSLFPSLAAMPDAVRDYAAAVAATWPAATAAARPAYAERYWRLP